MDTQYDQEDRCVVFFHSAAQHRSFKVNAVEKVYNSIAAAMQQQPCSKLSPLCRHCVCLWVAHTKLEEIEPRHHFHVQCNIEAHFVGPHTRYVYEAYSSISEPSSSSYVSLACLCSPFLTCDAPGISRQPHVFGHFFFLADGEALLYLLYLL